MTVPIGTRIAVRRKARRITQADLAKRVGMTASKLCRIEKGNTDPTEPEVAAIAAALGETMPEFYGEPGAPAASSPTPGELVVERLPEAERGGGDW